MLLSCTWLSELLSIDIDVSPVGDRSDPLWAGNIADNYISDGRFAFGDGAGFIQHHRLQRVGPFQGGAVFKKDTLGRPLAHPHHNRGGRG